MTPPIKGFGKVTPENSQEIFEQGTTNEEYTLVIEAAKAAILKNNSQATSSVEKMETPELESQSYKIDFGLSDEEKKSLKIGETKNGVTKEERDSNLGSIIVLRKDLAPFAFVFELTDDGKGPKHLAGKQLFTHDAVQTLPEDIKKRLPKDTDLTAMGFGYESSGGEKHKEATDKYFKKGDDYEYPGLLFGGMSRFDFIGMSVNFRLADGEKHGGLEITSREMYPIHYYPDCAYSVRLLKE